MKRTLILDENDLVMVVKQDVVKQIDEHRGELTRTEFVNYLIQCQLKQLHEDTDYVTAEDFKMFTRKMAELVHTFMDCVISHDINLQEQADDREMAALNSQVEALLGNFPADNPDNQ